MLRQKRNKPFRCPHADKVRKLTFDKDGNTFCSECWPHQGQHNPKLYTGRKFWTGTEVYGVERNKELAAEYERDLMKAAEMNRRRPPMNAATAAAVERALGR